MQRAVVHPTAVPRAARRRLPAELRDPRAALHDRAGNRGMLGLLRQRAERRRPDAEPDRERRADVAAERALARAPAPETKGSSLRGGPLPAATRAWLEHSFGAPLGGIRVHGDEHAARRARDERALAFTYGDDLYFAAGRFAPHTREGQRLIAHEVAHALQQRHAGQRQIQRKPDPGVAANDVFPYPVGAKVVQSSLTSQERLDQLATLAKFAKSVGGMSNDQLQSALAGLKTLETLAPIGASFTLVVKESTKDRFVADEDRQPSASGPAARHLELTRDHDDVFTLKTETDTFTTTPQRRPDGSWVLPIVVGGQAIDFVILPPGKTGGRRAQAVVAGQEIDIFDVRELPAATDAGIATARARREEEERLDALAWRPWTVGLGLGYALPVSTRQVGSPLVGLSARYSLRPLPTEVLSFPIGLDVMGWPSPGALIASARLGALVSPGGGTSFGVSTGASLGFLPDLRGSTDDKNRTLAVRGIDILAAVSQVLGPVRLDLLTGYTGGLGDSANLITMFLLAGGRFK